MKTHVLALYQFVAIDDPVALRQSLLALLHEHGLRGKIIVAHEGINGTIAGPPAGIDGFMAWLESDGRFDRLRTNRAAAERIPFRRALVKVKPEIVTMRAGQVDTANCTGTHVPPDEWNALIADPDTLVIDTRNAFEVEFGTFANAISPDTENFNDFPRYVEEHLAADKDRKIAMFCTGGIRCEKATAYMREQGFTNVYQLEGGILNYLQAVEQKDSKWEGECFVFDQRVSLTQDDA